MAASVFCDDGKAGAKRVFVWGAYVRGFLRIVSNMSTVPKYAFSTKFLPIPPNYGHSTKHVQSANFLHIVHGGLG